MGAINAISAIPLEQMVFSRRKGQGGPPGEASGPTKTQESPAKSASVTQAIAAGTACTICGSNHFSTVAGGLSEAMRFARDGGMRHPEVIARILGSQNELNAFERWDGELEMVVKLPQDEKLIMDEQLIASRNLRHQLDAVRSVADLEAAALEAATKRKDFGERLYLLRLSKLTPEENEDIKKRAAAVQAELGQEAEREMALEQAKAVAAEEAGQDDR